MQTNADPHPFGAEIVKLEARFDREGHPTLYKLPGNDGGGAYEIAGINSRYHPRELALLRDMPADQRAAECARYIEQYTRQGTGLLEARHVAREGTLFFILDTAFNRGAGGASRIVQSALVSLGYTMKSMGGRGWGPSTRAALQDADSNHGDKIVSALRHSREAYERDQVGVRANFWNGLVRRWDKVEAIANRWNDGVA